MTVLKPDLPTPRIKLLTIAEAAPLVRKTETAMRWWIRQKDCPIKVAEVGGRRLFIRQVDLEAYIEAQFAETS